MTYLNGGSVERAAKQEFGESTLIIDQPSDPFLVDIPRESIVFMSHADHITKMAPGFKELAHSDNSIAAIRHETKPYYGIQFHAEVTHTQYGMQFIRNFLFNVAGMKED
jgi:GMP synthase (glutamine-hydrolysing)